MNALPHTIRLTTGYSRSGPPDPLVTIRLTRGELLDLARLTEQQADRARREYRDGDAERLDGRAVALREAAR